MTGRTAIEENLKKFMTSQDIKRKFRRSLFAFGVMALLPFLPLPAAAVGDTVSYTAPNGREIAVTIVDVSTYTG